MSYSIVVFSFPVKAQDSILYRVMLMGDAGEINGEQQAILKDAVQKNIAGKTIAIFLGDNIYPKGMELLRDNGAQAAQDILRSEYEGLRSAGVPVYFIPGNHDWDKSGPKGYEKMIRVNQFLREQNDSLLQIIPMNACPGPYELTLSENLVVVAMDSEWWLYPFTGKEASSDCDSKTKEDVLGKLNDIIQRNKNKIVFFVTHHPFNSYGVHGGYYTLKDHLFPLTNLNKRLYIPLPVVGSLYPLLRTVFPFTEDLKSVLYRDMKRKVDGILKLHPNIIHAAGHEHALQLIRGAVLELVSGAGSKHTPVKKGKNSLFAMSASGFVFADILSDKSARLTYRVYHKGVMETAFSYIKPYNPPSLTADNTAAAINADSIKVMLNIKFDKLSKVHRWLFGEKYRKVWAMKATLPGERIKNVNGFSYNARLIDGIFTNDLSHDDWITAMEHHNIRILRSQKL